MFTGIIQGCGLLKQTRPSGGGLAFELAADFALDNPQEGESIAINGACLTAYNIVDQRFTVDVSPASLASTTLGALRAGDSVNMERALKLSDRLGGHLVSGHVDGVGRCKEVKQAGEFTILTFMVPPAMDRYIIDKGSVTIDGISLTVNDSAAGVFSVSIIPHTMQATTLGRLKSGSRVNIELDIIGKYVEKLLFAKADQATERAGIDVAFLGKNGYL